MHQDHSLPQDGWLQTDTHRFKEASTYDFRRTDRIPKEQIRAIRAIHDTFARGLASSPSAYLRTYVTVNLISVEQLSFMEFINTLPSPTCIASLTMKPFEASGMLEINPTLAFPLIEILLGGGKVKPTSVTREMTAIEQKILDGLLAPVLQNLSSAWQSVASIEFSIHSYETEPAMLGILTPNDAIIVIATEIQIGETSGMMNIGIPATVIKLLRQKFEQQWTVRKSGSEDEGARILSLIYPSAIELEAQLRGTTVSFADLLRLKSGDVLVMDSPIQEPVELTLNGVPKYRGHLAVTDRKKAVAIDGFALESTQ